MVSAMNPSRPSAYCEITVTNNAPPVMASHNPLDRVPMAPNESERWVRQLMKANASMMSATTSSA